MYRLLGSLKREEKGATAVEYGLILALIVLAIMGSLHSFANRANLMWNNVSTAVNKS